MLPARSLPLAAPVPVSRPAPALAVLLVGLAASLLLALAPVVAAGASATPARQVPGFGRLDESTPTPTPAPPAAPTGGGADEAGEPAGPYVRTLRLVLAGAVLLGVAGVTGLYLTRERP
ncbi:MAG: hypothetical protein M3P93_10430 [Actinomycetota bacterium]|nr:hypothetical protein [Actinomycetota bacterium]